MLRCLLSRSLPHAAGRSACTLAGRATPRGFPSIAVASIRSVAARRSTSGDAGSTFVEAPSAAEPASADNSSGETAADAALDSVSLSDTGVGRRGGGLRAMIRQRREDRQQRMDQAVSVSASGAAAASSPFPAANGSNWRDSPRIAALKQEAAGGIVRSTHVQIAPERLGEFAEWAATRLSDAYDAEGFRCGVLQLDRTTGSVTNHTYWTSELALAHCCARPLYAQVMNELRGFLGPDVVPTVEMRAAEESEAWKHGDVVMIGPILARLGRSESEVLGWMRHWKPSIPAPGAAPSSLPLLSSGGSAGSPLLYRPRVEWDDTVTAGDSAISVDDDRFLRMQVDPAVWIALTAHPTPPLLQFGAVATPPSIRISPVPRGDTGI